MEYGFHYIAAITKPQIESLLTKGVIQMGLFDQELAEAVSDDGVRYVLRRNPVRAQEIRKLRQNKLASLTKEVEKQNEYLAEHPGAHVEVALRRIDERCKKLRLSKWATPSASGQNIILPIDKEAQQALRDQFSAEIISRPGRPEEHAETFPFCFVEIIFCDNNCLPHVCFPYNCVKDLWYGLLARQSVLNLHWHHPILLNIQKIDFRSGAGAVKP